MKALHLPFDIGNPYQRQMIDALGDIGVDCATSEWRWRLDSVIAEQQPDVLHFHWLHHWAVGTGRMKFEIAFRRFDRTLVKFANRGGRIVWTVHNVQGHEGVNVAMDRRMSRLLALRASAVLVHSEAAKRTVEMEFPTARGKIQVIPHGHYCAAYKNQISRQDARARLSLGPGDTVFLFFGLIRRYKGLEHLLEAFASVRSPRARLVVAGRPFSEQEQAMIENASAQDARIRAFLGYVPDDDVQVFMNAADIVVYPYAKSLTSGALILGLSFGRPAVIPNNEAMVEAAGRAGFVIEEDGGLAQILSAIAEGELDIESAAAAAPRQIASCGWDSIAMALAEVYGYAKCRVAARDISRRCE